MSQVNRFDRMPPEVHTSGNVNFWAGRPIIGSERLVEELGSICGIDNLVITDCSRLVYPLMRRDALGNQNINADDLQDTLDKLHAENPSMKFYDELRLRIVNVDFNTKFKKRCKGRLIDPNARKIGAPIIDNEAFYELGREYFTINNELDPDRYHPIPSRVRIVESTTEKRAREATDAILRSGLFRKVVLLDRVSVCTSIKN